MSISFVIYGEPASKANSRQLVNIGGRPAFIKSKKALGYERDARLQLPERARVMYAVPVRVTMHVYYSSERPDLDESVILDVLQARYTKAEGKGRELTSSGVYINDRLVREKHIFHHIDRINPRAEITVEPIE